MTNNNTLSIANDIYLLLDSLTDDPIVMQSVLQIVATLIQEKSYQQQLRQANVGIPTLPYGRQ